jgi:hypothetical protein
MRPLECDDAANFWPLGSKKGLNFRTSNAFPVSSDKAPMASQEVRRYVLGDVDSTFHNLETSPR